MWIRKVVGWGLEVLEGLLGGDKEGFFNNLCAALKVQHLLLMASGGCTAAGDF